MFRVTESVRFHETFVTSLEHHTVMRETKYERTCNSRARHNIDTIKSLGVC